jgi:hypothetical protein
MCYYGVFDPNPRLTPEQKLAQAVRLYRERAEEEPAFRARYGDAPGAVLTSLPDAEALVAAGVPLDVRGAGYIQRSTYYLAREHEGAK